MSKALQWLKNGIRQGRITQNGIAWQVVNHLRQNEEIVKMHLQALGADIWKEEIKKRHIPRERNAPMTVEDLFITFSLPESVNDEIVDWTTKSKVRCKHEH